MKLVGNKKLLISYALVALLLLFFVPSIAQVNSKLPEVLITGAKKTNNTTVTVTINNGSQMIFDFYADHIFRLFQDSAGKPLRDPEATPAATILVNNPRKPVNKLIVTNDLKGVTITTHKILVWIDKNLGAIKAKNLATGKTAFEITEPVSLEKDKTMLVLKEGSNEYFFGGGVQNGRFTHKGKIIAIENQNSWTDGGVASPTPFYWSSNGYGVMWYTFKKGKYDFGAKEKGKVKLYHETNYLDVFFMVNDGVVPLLNDFYQLTGKPVLMPKFGFYEGHLNAYNRDYWKPDSTNTGMLYEDGKRYRESQKDNGGTKESLNGEKNNYQFSARAVVDRYKKHDMPLGWILPNDGYGAGYGQTGTLDSNILNLKSFGDYARKNGVEIGLWTQSDLHPKAGVSALLQRDIIKEVHDAGVRVLKTDVAWVGAGYSFGLNGVADVAQIMPKYGNNARPFIISLDGWAGTQRYAGIWTGDQTGGVWEYIRFHIPTYIGSGLSGQPNICSDMDGIFGGKNVAVNVRDFQWKTFTPMQLNMDGWGSNEKYPHALAEPATSINRMYLKWKSMLMPYTYSIAKEAVDGLPMVRAMFLNQPNAYTYSKATQYQFLYGPYFLVTPVYKNTKADSLGNDVRNNIYLPAGIWLDYFTGQQYSGNTIINNYKTPLWKLPVFVKNGAIIPLTNPNNHVSEINKKLRIYELYPWGKTNFTEYDDDGITEQYKQNKSVTTLVQSEQSGTIAKITIHPAKGNFDGFEKYKTTELWVNVTAKPRKITATVGNKIINITPVNTIDAFNNTSNAYYYNPSPELNNFASPNTDFAKLSIKKNPQVWIKIASTDITTNQIKVTIDGFVFTPGNTLKNKIGIITKPSATQVREENRSAFTLQPTWAPTPNADYYEILFNNMLYSTITDTAFLFEDLEPETDYTFQLRSVNKTGSSEWSTITTKTTANPFEFAIKGISGECSAPSQSGEGIANLFDFDEDNMWHTQWETIAVPFDLIVDLKTINQLDKLQYLPRQNGGNGIFMKGSIATSTNKIDWVDGGSFSWKRNSETKEFTFNKNTKARYVKISVKEALGNFGSGRELYVYKVPGTESFLPGDINNDRLIDRNDLTSYMNYTGLRKGDGDFEGYISNGDINKNNLIDAYDISVVATQLDGGISNRPIQPLKGTIQLSVAKENYTAGETIEVLVKGYDLQSVNALSFAIPYHAQDYEFIGVEARNMKKMENLTYDRLHTNGEKVLYPTFINLGSKETLNGSSDLFVIKLKAKKSISFDLKLTNGILVDRKLNSVTF